MTPASFFKFLAVTIATVTLLPNPVGLWPLIPLGVFGVWAEIGHLKVRRQMRRELQQVISGV